MKKFLDLYNLILFIVKKKLLPFENNEIKWNYIKIIKEELNVKYCKIKYLQINKSNENIKEKNILIL